jgi:hypothetical protein
MENTITRISDLPLENMGQNSIPTSFATGNKMGQSIGDSGLPTNYIPINVHANPYGISAQNPIMPNPEQTNAPRNQNIGYNTAPPQSIPHLSEEQMRQISNMQPQRLPSRDIHQDTTGYTHDEQVNVNYIPRAPVSSDYVRDYENMTEKNMREYEAKKKQESRLDMLLNEFQTPIFVALLFFMFQLPIVNKYLKTFSFLSIYNIDGNFNFNGLLLKSVLFGASYYSVYKSIIFLSEA